MVPYFNLLKTLYKDDIQPLRNFKTNNPKIYTEAYEVKIDVTAAEKG